LRKIRGEKTKGERDREGEREGESKRECDFGLKRTLKKIPGLKESRT